MSPINAYQRNEISVANTTANVISVLDNQPIMAPWELARADNIPNKNNPSNGPPNKPNILTGASNSDPNRPAENAMMVIVIPYTIVIVRAYLIFFLSSSFS